MVGDGNRRRTGRFARSSRRGAAEAVPAGALLLARRLAEEGRSPEEVRRFLEENFRKLDVDAALAQAFDDAPAST